MSSLDKGSESQRLDLDVTEENTSLLGDIIKLGETSDRENVDVILLIGITGSGKSAMINTIYKTLTGNYYQIAKMGSGNASSVTIDLNRFEHCGISLSGIMDEDRRQTLGKLMTKLPHIVDCAGLGDENTPKLREILELLIGGFIPPSTHIQELESKQTKFGVGCLKIYYPVAKPAWAASKVIFVQSCRDVIPKNLIQCLENVLNLTDPATLKRKYTAEVFLLITKYDLVRGGSVHSADISDNDTLTLEDLKEVEQRIAPELNIVGALQLNRIRWASFTDTIGYDNPNVDNIALKFLRRMMEPGVPLSLPSEPVGGLMKSIKLHMFMLSNQTKQLFMHNVNINPTSLLAILTVCVIVIAVLYKLLAFSL